MTFMGAAMSVSVWWLLPVFALGGTLGFFFCAVLTMSSREDDREEERWFSMKQGEFKPVMTGARTSHPRSQVP
jgi:hypothetical protein